MFNEYSDVITIDERCEMLRIGRNKAYELLGTGKIKAFQCGRTWVISKEAVAEFVRKCAG